MNIKIDETVKIKELNCKNNPTIINYFNQKGIVKGKKLINQSHYVPIIEFSDYTRIWIRPIELDIT